MEFTTLTKIYVQRFLSVIVCFSLPVFQNKLMLVNHSTQSESTNFVKIYRKKTIHFGSTQPEYPTTSNHYLFWHVTEPATPTHLATPTITVRKPTENTYATMDVNKKWHDINLAKFSVDWGTINGGFPPQIFGCLDNRIRACYQFSLAW